MTTFIPFTPSAETPFQFTATLDGTQYNVVVTWNIFGQRWYINVYDTSNNLICAPPMVGSPPNYDINLVQGFFNSVLLYRVSTGNFEISP